MNTYTTNTQQNPSVAIDSIGNFVVTWTSIQDGRYSGVYAQRYNSAGISQGSEFKVNNYTTGNQSLSSIVSNSNGHFTIVWGFGDIFAHKYNSEGDYIK